jgi:hypothetical protein
MLRNVKNALLCGTEYRMYSKDAQKNLYTVQHLNPILRTVWLKSHAPVVKFRMAVWKKWKIVRLLHLLNSELYF